MSARDRIFQAAVELLNEESNVESITVRRIAERADVAIGAVNYYYRSKDHLLNEAVGAMMRAEAEKWVVPDAEQPGEPEARLRALLKQTSHIGMRFPQLLEIMVRFELEHGTFTVAEIVTPLLRELWAGERSEADIRLAALQLISSLQISFLRRVEVARFTGYRLEDASQLELVIDRLIDNILCRAGSGANNGDSK
jgi:AcrR family transcriptional regulator